MRLIDADKIDFNKVFLGESKLSQNTRKVGKMLIDAQPTAYSVEKVVEELQENASRYTKKYLTPYGNNGYRDVKAISIHKAIEIVKQDGLSDDVCEWKYNDTEYYWESSCEHLHIFMSDGPKENEYRFCPYCGKKIEVVE